VPHHYFREFHVSKRPVTIDIKGRYTFWEIIPNDNCRFNNYDVLYEGKKKISKLNDKLQIIYSLSTQDVTFALTQVGEEFLCGYTLIKKRNIQNY